MLMIPIFSMLSNMKIQGETLPDRKTPIGIDEPRRPGAMFCERKIRLQKVSGRL